MSDYSDPPDSQGGRAAFNGMIFEKEVFASLRAQGYTFLKDVHHLDGIKVRTGHLFPETGCFAKQVAVPLTAPYHTAKNRHAVVDFLIHTPDREFVVLSIKSQQVNGTAEEKLEFELHQLVASELPSGLLVVGPLRGRDGKLGFSPDVLGPFWDRIHHFGERRIYPFRSNLKLCHWIRSGLPVAGKGRTYSSLIAEYCDREP